MWDVIGAKALRNIGKERRSSKGPKGPEYGFPLYRPPALGGSDERR